MKSKSHSTEILNNLDIVINKGACIYTQPKAIKAMKLLKDLLPSEEFLRISIAHNHYLIYEGAEELMSIGNELKAKYKVG